MESSSSRQTTTLASIIDAEKVIAPQRARALLAWLAQSPSVPDGPETVREWTEAIRVEHDASGTERALFSGSLTPAASGSAGGMRHVDALRAAAVAMFWGRESAQGPDGQPRYPRLRKLLVDQWDDTRGSCDGPDKLMMFIDATLALDRAAEPRVGRDGFKTLSLPTMDAAKKEVRVGTIGRPFEAIIETGKFKKGSRPDASEGTRAAKSSQGAWPTPQTSSIAQSPSPTPASGPPAPPQRSMLPVIAALAVVVVLGALLFFLR